ncbi:MAG TPA: hypothetical protein VIG33_03705 [Pseudobdellovibrionaceae bacterium]|jgi:hypothetical protein
MKNKPSLSTNKSDRLRELIRELGLPLRKLPDIISLNPEECLAWWSNQEIHLKIGYTPFSRLTSLVGIGENQLFTGDYDQDLARKRLMGDHGSLPTRYQENQNSFLRTSAHIIRYITLTRGQWFADQILYALNVSPLIYENPDRHINLTYFADLLELLSKKDFSQEELDTLSSIIFLSLQQTTLGQSFKASENFFDIYTTLAKNFDYFDSTFEYESHFVGKKYILKTVLHLDQHSQLKENPQSLRRLMRYRQILLAWFPYLGGMAPLFPKTEILRFSDVLEVQYELDLTPSSKQPARLLVV